jgi:tetratricopeptide (TPR) repeat protein
MRSGLAAGGNFALLHDYTSYLLSAQDYDEAETALAKMQGLGPARLDTLMLTGDLAANQEQFDKARSAYQEATVKFPVRSEPLIALATLADLQGKLNEAIALVEQAAKITPRSPQVEALRVQFASEQGDWEKVRTMLAGQESSLDPRSANGLTYAEALLELGHAEQARAIFAKALSLSPQNPYSRLMLAQAELATGDAASAFRTIQPLSDSVLADQRALKLAGKAARAAGDPAAIGLAARLSSPQTAVNQKLVEAGEAAMIRRDWGAAIAVYRQLPGYDGDAEVLKRLALASSKAGLHAEAIAYADKAVIAAPRNPDMPHIAGLVRLEAGRDGDQARRLLAQALQMDPSNRLFRADLGRAANISG